MNGYPSANDGEHMGRFLRNLQRHGLKPQVIVTDGSTLYPKLLAEIWPEAEQSEHSAWCRWRALQKSLEFQAIPELAKALESLEETKFAKMIAFLRGPASRRRQVRTNNHVERCNRELRYYEKVRYKWRRCRTLVRFLVLAVDRWWKEAFAPLLPQADSATTTQRQPTASSNRQQLE